MPKIKSTAFYRVLLREAWSLAWERKMLWIFGFLAAIISTGGVLDMGLRSFKRVQMGPSILESVLDGTFIGYDILVQFVQQIPSTGEARSTFTISAAIFLLVLFLVAAVWSQGALVSGILAKKPLPLQSAIDQGRHAFFHVLGIDLLAVSSTWFLSLLGTLYFLATFGNVTSWNILLALAWMFIFFPLVIIINIIATLAVVDAVVKKSHALDAIEHATRLFARHALVTFELGLMLFLLVFLAGLTFALALVVLSVPLAILHALALATGIPLIFLASTGLITTIYIVCTLAFAGAAVTFQYAAWCRFYLQSQKKIDLKRIIPKLHRLWWA